MEAPNAPEGVDQSHAIKYFMEYSSKVFEENNKLKRNYENLREELNNIKKQCENIMHVCGATKPEPPRNSLENSIFELVTKVRKDMEWDIRCGARVLKKYHEIIKNRLEDLEYCIEKTIKINRKACELQDIHQTFAVKYKECDPGVLRENKEFMEDLTQLRKKHQSFREKREKFDDSVEDFNCSPTGAYAGKGYIDTGYDNYLEHHKELRDIIYGLGTDIEVCVVRSEKFRNEILENNKKMKKLEESFKEMTEWVYGLE